MSLISSIRELLRRKPMTDEELRTQQEAELAADHWRDGKSSQLSGAGASDYSARGGR
jgi:hypothetical protein